MNIWVSALILLLGIEDMRTKKISLWLLEMLFVLSAIYGVTHYSYAQCLLGLLPGAILIVLAYAQKESIGIADGLLAIAYGLVYGWRHTCLWLLFSFLLVAIVGVCWKLITKRRKLQLPFVPFMAVVHMGIIL